MYKRLIPLLFLVPFSASADSSYSGDSLGKIYLEMRYLYELGLDIHEHYDLSDREQVGLCKFETGHNGTRARNLIGAVNRIDYPDKQVLIDAAWATYACSSCKKDASVCDTIPEQLDNIKKILESE
jgi:hypothetical protein